MNESEWLTCDEPRDMLNHLLVRVGDTPMHDAEFSVSERKLALFAAACMDGTDKEAEWREWADMSPRERKDKKKLTPSRAAEQVSGIRSGGWLRSYVGSPKDAPRRARLLREVVGNPFRPVTRNGPGHPDGEGWWQLQANGMEREILAPECLTPPALAIAQAAYEERDWGRLPVLADALEEASCTSSELLEHLRGPGPHCRGCWVVDLILGRD